MMLVQLRQRALTVAVALLAVAAPPVREAVAQAPQTGQTKGHHATRDAIAQSRVLALAEEVLAFTGEGYKTVPPGDLLTRLDEYLARMHTLAAEIADTPAAVMLADFRTRFERTRSDIAAVQARERQGASGVATGPQGRDDTALRRLRALVAELVTANGYTDLPPQQRLSALDGYLARLQALGPEVAGTQAAPIHEKALRDAREERASVAVQLGRDPAAEPGAAEGAYTDFEWMGQRTYAALTNPLQREDFRASLARGIDFDIGVSGIEAAPGGWLVHLSGRLGSSGTPGQGFFCRVAASDEGSLAVLRGITPSYGIVHMRATEIGAFTLQDRPLNIRIVFDNCRITPATGRTNPRPNAGFGDASRPLPAGSPAGQVYPGATTGRIGEPVAPSPPGLRCDFQPQRRVEEREMVRRLRQAWAIPEALRADSSLWLSFGVTLNFDGELTETPQLTRSQSRLATPEQLRQAVDAADRAIRTSAPFPELGQFAGGTMQVDMTPCD